ncbi:MAG TPA: ectonucleotide pyrophosphatase/phosphodiesterase [Candidatus Kapabacteria bacterium]|nr:ectonucleotide pyrophosphatase/phosphodiesterase [Candidatus Kapabacteria bacterium]
MSKYFVNIFLILLCLLSNISCLFANNSNAILLISLDGFRYDYIDRGLTPNMSKFADEGVRTQYLQSSYPTSTFPNHISIVTGLYPKNHGIIANNFVDYSINERFSIRDTNAVRNSKWYPKETFWETCKKNNIISASYFWAGSELNDTSRNPNYYQRYDSKRDYLERVDGVLKWLDLPIDKRPQFISLYFDAADTYGHSFGTESKELNTAIHILDSVLNYLFIGLKQRGLYDKLNIIIVSDHGMTNLSKSKLINLETIIPEEYADIVNHTAYCFVQPKENYEQKVKELLEKHKLHYQFYDRDSIPERYNFRNNKRISKIFIMADCGWALTYNQKWDNKYQGTHGYDNQWSDMLGFMIAKGPDFKSNYKSAGILNIDIYPLMLKILNLNTDNKIDGKLERIIHLLKNK